MIPLPIALGLHVMAGHLKSSQISRSKTHIDGKVAVVTGTMELDFGRIQLRTIEIPREQ